MKKLAKRYRGYPFIETEDKPLRRDNLACHWEGLSLLRGCRGEHLFQARGGSSLERERQRGYPVHSRVAHPSRKSLLQISLPGSFQLIAGRAQTHDLSLIAITQTSRGDYTARNAVNACVNFYSKLVKVFYWLFPPSLLFSLCSFRAVYCDCPPPTVRMDQSNDLPSSYYHRPIWLCADHLRWGWPSRDHDI